MGNKSKYSQVKNLTKSHPLRVNILAIFALLIIITVLIIVFYTYIRNSNAILALSEQLTINISNSIIEKTTNYMQPAAEMAEFSSKLSNENIIDLENSNEIEKYSMELIKRYPQLSMFNIGDESGNFIMPKKMKDGTIAVKVIKNDKMPHERYWKYYDKSDNIIKIENITGKQYDPRVRPWYIGAKKNNSTFWTDLYIFFTDKKPGITASYPVYNSEQQFWGVFSLDIEISELSEFLSKQKIGKTGLVYIVNKNSEIVAFPSKEKLYSVTNDKLRPLKVEELESNYITKSYNIYKEKKKRRFTFKSKDTRYIATYTPFPSSFAKDWLLGVVVPENDFIGTVKHTNQISLIISFIILTLSIFLVSAISKSISKPIELLKEETNKIKDFDLTGEINIKSHIQEIQTMSLAISNMKHGLRAFKKYVPSTLVRKLIETGEETNIGGKKEDITLFFLDIKEFTAISEKIPAEKLMNQLYHYFDELSNIILKKTGTIDKYIGDAIMAFWGAPVKNESHAILACEAALKCKHKTAQLKKLYQEKGDYPFEIKIGIHTGEAIVGNVGSTDRINYTALGDNVNLASRLDGLCKTYGVEIIITESTANLIDDYFYIRPLDVVIITGKKKSTKLYELLAIKNDDVDDDYRLLSKYFTQAYDYLTNAKWFEAYKILEELNKSYPEDIPTSILLQRCRNFIK